MFKILIVDDEPRIREIFSLVLAEGGYSVDAASCGEQALTLTSEWEPDLVLLDMNLPDLTGLEVLRRIREKHPETDVVILTAYGTVRSAVEATRLGAADFLEKPVDNQALLSVLGRVLEVKRLQRQVASLQSELAGRFRFADIVGASGRMHSIFQSLERFAAVDGTVLITGESGTGKELVARALHFQSHRREGPFVVVNCGAIPRELMETEFFGHTRGAFSEARSERSGKFEQAHRGTLFLDEIGDISFDAQVKLLRVLSEKEIVRVGGSRTIPVDVRVIAATNRDLPLAVRQGQFREDLYWRLAVLSVQMPSLRERKEDLPLLCEHFVARFNRELGKTIRGVAPRALPLLQSHSWPGNVRELESLIYEAMVFLDEGWIEAGHLPPRLLPDARASLPVFGADSLPAEFRKAPQRIPQGSAPTTHSMEGDWENRHRQAAEEAEREVILAALRQESWHRERAARLLGISRKTLFNKMRQYGLSDSCP